MTTLALQAAAPRPSVPEFLAALVAREPLLAGTGLLLLAMMLPNATALLADARTLNGIAVWVKPLKFQTSVGLYLLTLAWFWGYVAEATRRRAWMRATAWAAAVSGLGEVLYITLQAGRGVPSHFNDSTAWEAVAYGIMGVGAVALTAASLVLGLAIWRRGAALPPAFRLAVVLGLVLTFALGMGTGMVTSANGGHWVGGTLSDAGGLPVFGWSRTGGDLRVAHFFGMHAMHVLPVLGWIAALAISGRNASRIVWSASAVYAALTLAILAQALAGRPFLPWIG
jgi:hypothetical protein